jgi:hypothetical protein
VKQSGCTGKERGTCHSSSRNAVLDHQITITWRVPAAPSLPSSAVRFILTERLRVQAFFTEPVNVAVTI